MAKTSVVVTLNGTNTKERKFVAELVQYLNARNIEVVADDLSLPENRIIHELLNHRWLVLILTPETARLRHIQAVVNAALEYVEEGHLQGVLALSYGNAPIEPEEMPYPWWSTIRTYHAGEGEEDHRRAFEKVHRTVSYARVPALVGASTTANSTTPQNALYDTRTSHPSIIQPLPPPKRRVPIRILAITFVVLLSVLSGMLIDSKFFHRSPANSVLVTVTPGSHHGSAPRGHSSATPNATRTAEANVSATAQATLTAIANATANDLYQKVTGSSATFTDLMNGQDTKFDWDQNNQCMFQPDGQYHISSQIGQYTTCMAKNKNFTDFAYQVDMTIESGDEGGLIFRSDAAIKTFYRFSLSNTGNYSLFVCQSCTGNQVVGGKQLANGDVPNVGQAYISVRHFNRIIRQPAKLNATITIIVIKQIINVYINGDYITKIDDSITSSGLIGLYAESKTQPADIAFSNVNVWENLPQSS